MFGIFLVRAGANQGLHGLLLAIISLLLSLLFFEGIASGLAFFLILYVLLMFVWQLTWGERDQLLLLVGGLLLLDCACVYTGIRVRVITVRSRQGE